MMFVFVSLEASAIRNIIPPLPAPASTTINGSYLIYKIKFQTASKSFDSIPQNIER